MSIDCVLKFRCAKLTDTSIKLMPTNVANVSVVQQVKSSIEITIISLCNWPCKLVTARPFLAPSSSLSFSLLKLAPKLAYEWVFENTLFSHLDSSSKLEILSAEALIKACNNTNVGWLDR